MKGIHIRGEGSVWPDSKQTVGEYVSDRLHSPFTWHTLSNKMPPVLKNHRNG